MPNIFRFRKEITSSHLLFTLDRSRIEGGTEYASWENRPAVGTASEVSESAEALVVITNYIYQFSNFITGHACIKHPTIGVQRNLNCRQVSLNLDVRYTVGYINLLLQMHHP